MKKKLKKRMNIISAVLFAVISFMLFAPLSIPFAAFMTIGALCMPFIKLPAGILGTGTAGGDVDEKIKKILLHNFDNGRYLWSGADAELKSLVA